MKKKRNLLEELNINRQNDFNGPYNIDIQKIKGMVHNNIDSAYSERKIGVMKSKKKFSIIAVAAALVLGITAFAASGIITSWYGSSSSIPDYRSLPTEQQCIKDIGYAPVLVETFENGYTFKEGSIVNNDLRDDNGNSVEKFRSVDFRYAKNGDTVYFSQDKYNSEIENTGDVVATEKGIDIYYYSYMNKCVAGNYKLTEEEKEAEKNGEIVFSYGVEKNDIVIVQSVSWVKDGIHYELMQMDGKLSADELAEMAIEAIGK